MDIFAEMAIDTLHSAREMNILQVNRFRKFIHVLVGNRFVVEGKQVPVTIFLEDGSEDPAVAMVVRELGLLELRIQFGNFFEKIEIAPVSARGGSLGILLNSRDHFSVGRVLLLFRIHELAVALLVPPGVTEIRIHEEIALVHVAGDALARRDRARETMVNRMPALILGNGRIAAEAESLMAELAVIIGIRRRAIIRVDHVTRGATARAIITRTIIRSKKSEQRIVQARFLQTEK